eukprot:gnl/TRDRNA2_/TRDRNA2_89355_c0_seq1.p1 gnl/TRDRNA2_/TRDRNA2_89355_c0~~gnl/TRDRNA2_/TRDRNA2_89355_c0_seq1.p1  ORF type:complete len:232 (+),score=16.34 gnl/TRDRNA2_/TRDRNA2_89355_c0_seq1:3-698(+)
MASLARAFRQPARGCLGPRASTTLGDTSGPRVAAASSTASIPRPKPKRIERAPRNDTDAFETPMQVLMRTIAVVRSPYKERFGCPRQPQVTTGVASGGAREGTIEFVKSQDDKIATALQDLDGFEYIWLISNLHLNEGWSPRVIPPRGTRQKRGVFATRAPHRPNHIGLSACRLVAVDHVQCLITVRGLDLLDGTPILDIKPYIPYCDSFPTARSGWLEGAADDMEGSGLG